MRKARSTAGPPRYLYTVTLHTGDKAVQLPVTAETPEQATVEAARFWGIPWTRALQDMDVEQGRELPRRLCPRCGNYVFESQEDYCEKCRRELAVEKENLRRRAARYFREQANGERRENG